jgi:2'-5' RNA ligase
MLAERTGAEDGDFDFCHARSLPAIGLPENQKYSRGFSSEVECRDGNVTLDRMLGENLPAFLRLFIALPVSTEVRDKIARAQGQLRRAAPSGAIRWTRPEQFHLTLKFLGDIPSARLDALNESVAEVCANFSAIQLTAAGVGFFPHAQKPRVLWAGATDAVGRLEELQRRMHAAVLPFAPADRSVRFSGHITLGRFKPGHFGSLKNLLERAARLRTQNFGGWPAETTELVRSELTSDGATHTPVGIYRLTAGRATPLSR